MIFYEKIIHPAETYTHADLNPVTLHDNGIYMNQRISKLILLLILSSLIMLPAVPGAADSIQDATIWVNKGKILAESKDFQAAISAYDQALTLDSFYADAWELRGDSLMAMQRYAEAADSYERTITIDKTNAEIFAKKGRALYMLGKYRDALEYYDRATSLKPNLFPSQDGRGDVLTALNRYSEAVDAYDVALKIEPKNNATWNKKGTTLARIFRNEEAVEAFNQSVTIYPGSAEVWNNMGSVLFNMGRMQDALKAFERAIALDESYIPQKYGDTISRLQQDRQEMISNNDKNSSPVTGSGTAGMKLLPPIFLINYLMIGIGILSIMVIGSARFYNRRFRKKQ